MGLSGVLDDGHARRMTPVGRGRGRRAGGGVGYEYDHEYDNLYEQEYEGRADALPTR